MNLKGEPAFVGRHCGSHSYRVTPELVRFYADALDDPSPLYDAIAPSLLFHSECYKVLGEWYLKNLFGNLHARQDWELFGEIPIGATVRTRSTIIERYYKRGRDYVVNETDLLGEDGRLLVRGRTHQSFLPVGGAPKAGFVVDQKTAHDKAAREPRAAFPSGSGPDLPSIEKVVDERRCWMFSGPGKNYHTDREMAAQLGFPNIVVQGMMSTCFVHQLMQDRFGRGWVVGGKMSVKLTNVLWVDERVVVRGKVREEWPEGTGTRVACDVWAEKADGTKILVGDASALA